MTTLTLLGDVAPCGAASNALIHTSEYEPDVLLFNLETPLDVQGPARAKAGPALAGSAAPLGDLHARRCVASVANNHMFDFGLDGFLATRETVERVGISLVGGGDDLASAAAPFVFESGGVRVGVLACAERQFGVATECSAGVAPLRPLVLASAIRELRSRVDHVIVSIHGGAELCPWPSPGWRDMLRGLVECGASIVHGHHAHVPQGWEQYGGGIILYGLGNCLADPGAWRTFPNALWSLAADVDLTRSGVGDVRVRMLTIEERERPVVRPAREDEIQSRRDYMDHACSPVSDTRLLTGLWQEFAVRVYRSSHAASLGFDRPDGDGAVSDHLAALARCLLGKRSAGRSPTGRQLRFWYHLFACRTHRDTIAAALGVLCGEIADMRCRQTAELADTMMPWSRSTGRR